MQKSLTPSNCFIVSPKTYVWTTFNVKKSPLSRSKIPRKSFISLRATNRSETPKSARTIPKRKVVEHISLWKMKATLDDKAEMDMLDNLYSIQYHYRNVISLSLGRLSSATRDYTHALFARFPDRSALETFLSLPALHSIVNNYVDPHCEESLKASFESEVEADVIAMFRRGDDFESGIERLVLLTAKENASKKGKTELVESFMNLPEIIGPGVVQLTAGEVFSKENTSSTHGLVVRLSSEEELELYVNHPVHKEILLDKVLPLTKEIFVAEFRVDPVGTTVM